MRSKQCSLLPERSESSRPHASDPRSALAHLRLPRVVTLRFSGRQRRTSSSVDKSKSDLTDAKHARLFIEGQRGGLQLTSGPRYGYGTVR